MAAVNPRWEAYIATYTGPLEKRQRKVTFQAQVAREMLEVETDDVKAEVEEYRKRPDIASITNELEDEDPLTVEREVTAKQE